MKKTKLDSEHTFLQFLMMFLSLAILLIFSHFVENLLWFENSTTVIPITSGILIILISGISFYRYTLKPKERRFLLFGIFFLLLGLLTLFITFTNSLSFSTSLVISIALILPLLFILIFFFIKKNWLYSNLEFWILFSLSLFIFSRIFFLEAFLRRELGLLNYSYLISLFGYLALGIGFVNEVCEVLPKKKRAKRGKKK